MPATAGAVEKTPLETPRSDAPQVTQVLAITTVAEEVANNARCARQRRLRQKARQRLLQSSGYCRFLRIPQTPQLGLEGAHRRHHHPAPPQLNANGLGRCLYNELNGATGTSPMQAYIQLWSQDCPRPSAFLFSHSRAPSTSQRHCATLIRNGSKIMLTIASALPRTNIFAYFSLWPG